MRRWKFLEIMGLALAVFLTSASSAMAEWHQVTTDNFIVYGEGSSRSVASEAEQLERLDRLMRQTFSMNPESGGRKLPVYLVRNHTELREVIPNSHRLTRGFYRASVFGVSAALIRGEQNHVLFHEYAHHFMLQNFPGHYPSWFVEGFAEYFATADVKTASRVSLGYFSPGRMHELNQGRWISMEQLLTGDTRTLTPSENLNFYALSWLMTHFMITDPDRLKALGGYLEAQRQGVAWDEALQTHLGMSPEDLRKALRSYLNGSMRYGRFSMDGTRIETSSVPLPPSADQFILPHAALQAPIPAARAQELLTELKPLAARYANDPLALSVLANLEQVWGDDAEAERLLSHLLTLDPNNVDGLRIMAQLRIEQAEDLEDRADQIKKLSDAQSYLVRAMQADPTDFRVYRHLASIRQHADNYPTQNDLDTLIMALTYAPQVTGLRLQTADALRRSGRVIEAEVLLNVLKSQPHAAGEAPGEDEGEEAPKDPPEPAEPSSPSQ